MTIYALSTVYGKSGVAIIRISGNNALQAVKRMTGLEVKSIIPRHGYFTDIKDIVSHATLDKSLVLYFQAPNSFTGEDVVEFHIHGSKAVISSVLKNLSQIEGFRLAEPGEFSKRAFYNNKMDLTEAEGLADLIDAETSEQQKFALRQMEGNLKNTYEAWRADIIQILAYLEAYIDFPEENIPESLKNNILNDVFKLSSEINEHLSTDNIGERLREGFRVVIIGPPNAGKSSLLNALVKREAAIVSDIAGTTRDAIDIHLDIKGYPVIITDTAGIREVEEQIEKKGIEIAFKKIAAADLVLCLFDSSQDTVQVFENIEKSFKNNPIYIANKTDKLKSPNDNPSSVIASAARQPNQIINPYPPSPLQGEAGWGCNPSLSCHCEEAKPTRQSHTIHPYCHAELVEASSRNRQYPPCHLERSQQPQKSLIHISAKSGDGIDALIDTIYNRIKERFTSNSNLLITRHRYREALQNALKHLQNFNLDKEIELSAEDIRLTARELGKITGRIEVDDILNKIFGDFCIGK